MYRWFTDLYLTTSLISTLQHRQKKMQQKRSNTSRETFVREVCSRMPVMFYSREWGVSRFPESWREGNIFPVNTYYDQEPLCSEYTGDFFANLTDLFRETPKMMIQQWFENNNSRFAEVYGAKNAYLSFGVGQDAENILYTTNSNTSIKNVYNSIWIVGNCDNIYSCKVVTWWYMIFYSANIHSSSTIWFSSNLLWCSECLFCDGLQNQSYCINNKQYEKDDYIQKKKELLSSKSMFPIRHDEVNNRLIDNKLSENVEWMWLVECNDVENWYYSKRVKKWRNIYFGWGEFGGEYFYDAFDAGNQTDSHLYGVISLGENSSHAYIVCGGANVTNVYYWHHLESCSYCLWCVGLKNKSYCILNKQYTKEEWYIVADQIFAEMDEKWLLWEFFPPSMNPFYFNDTAASLIDTSSFSREEILKLWYLWRDDVVKTDVWSWANVVPVADIDTYEWYDESWVWNIDQGVCKKVLVNENWDTYRIMPLEYQFLQKHFLPLPRKHWMDRMKDNFKIER